MLLLSDLINQGAYQDRGDVYVPLYEDCVGEVPIHEITNDIGKQDILLILENVTQETEAGKEYKRIAESKLASNCLDKCKEMSKGEKMIKPCEEWFNDYNPDQTAKADKGKPRLSLVPTEIINCIARVREYGVTKYTDPDNWKRVEIERYHDALFRHLIAYINDPKSVDEESGLPHLWHIATNCAFLCELEKDNERK